jgi:hypothetical protein
MNYKTLFRDTLWLFRESKLLWMFGVIAFVSEFFFRGSVFSIGDPPVPWMAYACFPIALYFSFVAKCSLIYSTNQILSEQRPTPSEVWDFCKAKLRRIAGLYFLSIPLVMFSVFIVEIVFLSELSTLLTRSVDVLVGFFLSTVLTFSICTIVIHNLEAGLALWTGLSIVVNNLIHVVALNGIFLLLQLVLYWSIGNAIFDTVLLIPLTVTMTLAYRVFVAKGSYPALSNTQPTA